MDISYEMKKPREQATNRENERLTLLVLDRENDTKAEAFFRSFDKILRQSTNSPQLIMWSYLFWYLYVTISIPPTSYQPYISAIYIMILIGVVLNANAYLSFKTQNVCIVEQITLPFYLQENASSVFRLFLIPFCVASYSGISNDRGDQFHSIFPADSSILNWALVTSMGVPTVMKLCAIALQQYIVTLNNRQFQAKHVPIVEVKVQKPKYGSIQNDYDYDDEEKSLRKPRYTNELQHGMEPHDSGSSSDDDEESCHAVEPPHAEQLELCKNDPCEKNTLNESILFDHSLKSYSTSSETSETSNEESKTLIVLAKGNILRSVSNVTSFSLPRRPSFGISVSSLAPVRRPSALQECSTHSPLDGEEDKVRTV